MFSIWRFLFSILLFNFKYTFRFSLNTYWRKWKLVFSMPSTTVRVAESSPSWLGRPRSSCLLLLICRSLFSWHGLFLSFKLHDLSVDLKPSGGLELSGNQIELTYPIFGIQYIFFRYLSFFCTFPQYFDYLLYLFGLFASFSEPVFPFIFILFLIWFR